MQDYLCIIFIFLLGSFCRAQSRDDSSTFVPQYKRGINYTVQTRSGGVYSGFVKEETKEFVVLENRITHETAELRKSEIVHVGRARTYDAGDELLGENFHARSYLLLNSAFTFDEGKASTNSHWLLLENIGYAITENWAVSLNTIAFYPVSLGVKCAYQISNDNYLGASVFGIGDIYAANTGSFLFGYGAQATFTKGSSNKNFTFSGGVIGLTSDLFYTSSSKPFVNLAFMSAGYCKRLSKGVALCFEGWYLPEANAGLGGAGVKFVGDETTCWSIGCYALTNSYDNTLKLNLKTLPIPYFGVARRFN